MNDTTVCATNAVCRQAAAAYCRGYDWIANQKTFFACLSIYSFSSGGTHTHYHTHTFSTHTHTLSTKIYFLFVDRCIHPTTRTPPLLPPLFFYFFSHFFLFWLSFLEVSPSFALLLLCYPSLFLISSLFYFFCYSSWLLTLSTIFCLPPSTTTFNFLFLKHASFLSSSPARPPIHHSIVFPSSKFTRTYTFYITDLSFKIYLFIFIHFTSVCHSRNYIVVIEG